MKDFWDFMTIMKILMTIIEDFDRIPLQFSGFCGNFQDFFFDFMTIMKILMTIIVDFDRIPLQFSGFCGNLKDFWDFMTIF